MTFLSRLIVDVAHRCPRTLVTLLLTFSLFTPALSLAAAPGGQSAGRENPINYQRPTIERRGGFAMAFNFGYGLSAFSGYPNEVVKLNDPQFLAKTKASLGSTASLWFGGAIRDWLVIGGGFSTVTATVNQLVGNQFGVILHLDLFPLYSLGRVYRDLGFTFDGGLGMATIFDKDDRDDLLADSGSLSTVGLSVFYEPLRFWKLSQGPQLSYTHGFSQSLKSHTLTLGWRIALYSGQPKTK